MGGPLEIVVNGETGLLVPPSAPAELAAAIRRLLADPAARAAMGRKGRLRFEERFTAESMARNILEIYREAAGMGKTRGRGDESDTARAVKISAGREMAKKMLDCGSRIFTIKEAEAACCSPL